MEDSKMTVRMVVSRLGVKKANPALLREPTASQDASEITGMVYVPMATARSLAEIMEKLDNGGSTTRSMRNANTMLQIASLRIRELQNLLEANGITVPRALNNPEIAALHAKMDLTPVPQQSRETEPPGEFD